MGTRDINGPSNDADVVAENTENNDAEQNGGQAAAPIAPAAERLARLQSLSAALMGCVTPADCADTVLREGIAAMGARAGSVVLLQPEGDTLEIVGTMGYPEEEVQPWRAFPLTTLMPIAEAVRTGEPVFLPSRAEQSIRYPLLAPRHDHAWATIPLLADGRAFGCLGLSYAQRQPFAEDERAFLMTLGQQCAMALERARMVAVLEAQRTFLRDVLASVTEGRLVLCEGDLPPRLAVRGKTLPLAERQEVRAVRLAALDAAAACGLSVERAHDLETAAAEAAANAVAHGGGGWAQVCLDAEAGRAQVWVADQGRGIALHRLPRATLEKGYTTGGTLGHGFKMVLILADRVYLRTGPQGTTVVIEMGREPLPLAW